VARPPFLAFGVLAEMIAVYGSTVARFIAMCVVGLLVGAWAQILIFFRMTVDVWKAVS
jgi:hypothetical protein